VHPATIFAGKGVGVMTAAPLVVVGDADMVSVAGSERGRASTQ